MGRPGNGLRFQGVAVATPQDQNVVRRSSGAYRALPGRFMSVDPVLDLRTPQSHNAYSYVVNNPVNRTDPTGTETALDEPEKDPFEDVEHTEPVTPPPGGGQHPVIRFELNMGLRGFNFEVGEAVVALPRFGRHFR